MLSEICSLLRTNNVRGQISGQVFVPRIVDIVFIILKYILKQWIVLTARAYWLVKYPVLLFTSEQPSEQQSGGG